ncbi:MAG: radical SAM protein [Candidatus Omnitrophica bacterium]|nr:radical SAM protein [Candidatus Omnitrophota bacterium]MDD5553335.1 radical SAM protein [Candidatus Omnitrophota bacterium]
MADNKDNIRKKPDFCVIEVSHKCMLQCKMCNYWKAQDEPAEITNKELFKFVASLKEFVDMPFEMNISGGEPLLKEGILDLIEFIASRDFRFSLVTNAYMINKAVAKRIADSGLSFLAISLDSIEETTQDFLRGRKGAYWKVMEALGYFTGYRGKLRNLIVQTIIMEPNLNGILDLAHWAQERQLSLSFMALTRPNMIPIDPAWYKKEGSSILWPKDIQKVHSVLDALIELKASGYRIDNPVGQLQRFKLYFSDPEKFVRETPCGLGTSIIHINPRGDVHLCCEMEPIGNIKEADISEIWLSEKGEKVRENIRLCNRNCAEMVNCYREAV